MRRIGAVIAIVLWTGGLLGFALSLYIEARRVPPVFANLVAVQGALVSAGPCGGKGRNHGFSAELRQNQSATTVRLPCTPPLQSVALGVSLVVRQAMTTNLLGERHFEVWQVESGSSVLYAYADRLAREQNTSWVGYILAVVVLALGAPLMWFLARAVWVESSRSVKPSP